MRIQLAIGASMLVTGAAAQSTSLVSVAASGVPGGGQVDAVAISGDGNVVVFQTTAKNLSPIDRDLVDDVFVHDLVTGITERASVGDVDQQATAISYEPSVSHDGRYVAFGSQAANLVSGDVNGKQDVFRRDRLLGVTEWINLSTLGVQDDGYSRQPVLSGGGSRAAFASSSGSLVAGDKATPPGTHKAYLRDWSVQALVTTYCTAKVNSVGCTPRITSAGLPRVSGDDAFFLVALQVLKRKIGVFFWGTQAQAVPFGCGTLCVKPPLVRSGVLDSGGSASSTICGGIDSYYFRQNYMSSHGIGAGVTIRGQFWSRDPGFTPPDNVGLSDAITFVVAP